MSRRMLLLLASLALALPLAARADEFPSRPLHLVVPFGPGTTSDIIARVFADAMAKPLGQAVVVENKAGAGGNIGADLVAKSAPDGYTPTLLVVSANSPIRSLKDLQAAAAKSGGISFASAGNGTSGHLAGKLRAAVVKRSGAQVD